MPIIAVFQGPSLTQEQYEGVVRGITGGAKSRMEAIDDWPVEGILAHAAGNGPNGFRVVDVWDSEESFQRFGEKLMPVLQQVGVDVQPEVYPAQAFVSA